MKRKPVNGFLLIGITIFFAFLIERIITGNLTGRQFLVDLISVILTTFILGFVLNWIGHKMLGFRALRNDALMIDLQPGEEIYFEAPANHLKGIEAVGGKLYLTNQRLFFRSHRYNFQNHFLSIPINRIHNIDEHLPWHRVKKTLLVKLDDGRVEKFIVEQPDLLKQKLQSSLLLS